MSEQRIRDRLQLLIECGVTDNRKLAQMAGAGLTTVKRVKGLTQKRSRGAAKAWEWPKTEAPNAR